MGRVCLVGAGPGDTGLITVRGLQRLAEADVIVFDALANRRLLDHARGDAVLIDAGKRARRHKLSQDQINDLLAEHARAGRTVVRLKGGDPYIFGRGSEEAIFLGAQGIEVEVVPGVPAATAGPACAGVPLTHRGLATSCTFITGHEDPTKPQAQVDYAPLAALVQRGGTLCFYMAMGRLPRIVDELTRHGVATDMPAAVVQWATLPTQRSVRATLGSVVDAVERAGLGAPAIIVVGPVAGLDDPALNGFERRPLFGRTCVVTRTRPQASDLARQLEALGAAVIEAPTIAYGPPPDPRAVREALLEGLADAAWLVLTSPQAVAALGELLEGAGRDARALATVQLAVVGDATAQALHRRLGVRADCQPHRQTAAALGAALVNDVGVSGRRVVMLRSDIAGRELPALLADAGAEVVDLVAYRTQPVWALPDELLEALRERRVDWLTFTSSSTARYFVELLGGDGPALLAGVRVASIGPATSAACRELGLGVDVEAEAHDIHGLIAALCRAAAPDTSGGPDPRDRRGASDSS